MGTVLLVNPPGEAVKKDAAGAVDIVDSLTIQAVITGTLTELPRGWISEQLYWIDPKLRQSCLFEDYIYEQR